jgi:hypothetical protein
MTDAIRGEGPGDWATYQLGQPRQCGEDVLRMFVTGGPPVRGGGGIPQRIIAISRPDLP